MFPNPEPLLYNTLRYLTFYDDLKVKPLKIGMFDSGIGGLSILKKLLCQRSDLEIYYWADDAHTPYGSKSDNYVKGRCHAICESFVARGIKMIVVACNTATAIAIHDLRSSFPQVQFVGIEPYVNVVNHIPWQAEHRAIILTTPLTGRSERFMNLKAQLDPEHKLDHFSCPELAIIVESAFWQGAEHIEAQVQQELLPLQGHDYAYAILGCTHYPLVGHYIQKVLNTQVISPCAAVARRVLSLLEIPALPAASATRLTFQLKRSSRTEDYQAVQFYSSDVWPAL